MVTILIVIPRLEELGWFNSIFPINDLIGAFVIMSSAIVEMFAIFLVVSLALNI